MWLDIFSTGAAERERAVDITREAAATIEQPFTLPELVAYAGELGLSDMCEGVTFDRTFSLLRTDGVIVPVEGTRVPIQYERAVVE